MTRLFLSIILNVSFFTTTSILNVEVPESQVEWTGKAAFSSYALNGNLKVKEGNLEINEAGQIAAVSIILDMPTISSSMPKLTKHLRSKDFFQVKKYPEATFQSNQLNYHEDGQVDAIGTITIKGITKTQTITFTMKEQSDQLQCEGTLKIDRTQFGIFYNSPNYFDQLKEQAIADKFTIDFNLIFK